MKCEHLKKLRWSCPIKWGNCQPPDCIVPLWRASMTAHATPTPPSLNGVSAENLALFRITLQTPHESAAVTQEAAVHTALSHFPGSQLRDDVLAHALKPYRLPATGRLCWVVSITPPMATVSGPPGSKEIPVRYFLVFIDAQTGQFLFFHYFADANATG